MFKGSVCWLENVFHQFHFFNLVQLQSACSCCRRRLPAKESNLFIEQFAQTRVNVSPGPIVFVLLLYPINCHIRTVLFQRLLQVLVRERSDLLNSHNRNILNFINIYLSVQFVSFGLELIVKLAIADEDSLNFTGVRSLVTNDWKKLLSLKNVINGSVCLGLNKKLLL